MSIEYIKMMAKELNSLPKSDFKFEVELAQAILESDWGKSELATEAKNHFGHKYSDYTDDHYIKDAQETVNGKLTTDKNVWWRKYKTIADGVKDHSAWLTRAPKYEKIYAKAIAAKDWRVQAKELMGIYATDIPTSFSIGYEKKLTNIIEKYELWQYNERDNRKEEKALTKFPKPAMIDRRKSALGYPGAGAYSRRPKSAITMIVEHYTATDSSNIEAHERFWRTSHGWEIGGYPFYINRAGTIFWNYDFDVVTYGASAANPYCTHISCEAKLVNGKPNYTAAQIKSREALTLWLMQELSIPASRVRGHLEVPGNSTNCPGYSTRELDAFRADIGKKFAAGSGASVPSKPAPKQPVITVSKTGTYTVKHGDNLWVVATAHGLTLNQIRELNQDMKSDMLRTGQKLVVKGSVPPVVSEDKDQSKEVGVKNPKEYPSKGKFKFNTAVNVRNSPRLDNKPVALYNRGESVNYDRVLYGASYTWLSYISYNGARRYCAVGDNGGMYGEFV